MRVLEQGNPLQVAPEPLVALRSPPCPFVDFLFGRRGSAFTPHRISLRPTARLLRLPLKGGVMGLGARASRPHPCSLWGLLSISATLQAATTSAGTATAGSKESQGAVGSIQVWEKAEAVPGLVRAGRPRSQEAFDHTVNGDPRALIVPSSTSFLPWPLASWPFTDPFQVFSNPLEFLPALRGCPLSPSRALADFLDPPRRLSGPSSFLVALRG